MTYDAQLVRHLEPDHGPDHGEDCATHPCRDCAAIADDWRDEVLQDMRRDGL